MRWIRFVVVLCAAVWPCLGSESPGGWVFPVGEEIHYRFHWGIFPIGRCRVATEWVERDGRRLLKIHYRAYTNPVFDHIYPIDDVAESFVDPATFLPVEFTMHFIRRSDVRDEVVTFDHAAGRAWIRQRATGDGREIPIDGQTRDILAFMYHMRSHPLPDGMKQSYRVVAVDGIVDLDLEVLGRETMKHPVFGKLLTTVVTPRADLRDMIIEGGRIKLWTAGVPRMLGVKLLITAPLADVRVSLCGVTGPGDDAWVRKTREAGELSCE